MCTSQAHSHPHPKLAACSYSKTPRSGKRRKGNFVGNKLTASYHEGLPRSFDRCRMGIGLPH